MLFLACLLFALALNLLGFFEIAGRFMGWGSGLSSKEGWAGSFFTGALAVLVATPCTAPFMGSAVGYALSQSAPLALATFTALALGLAAPYLALCSLPAAARLLPRPGRWMETFKQAMAFPLFATVIWLAWVLGLEASVPGLVALLCAFTAIGFAVWLAARWPSARQAATALALVSVLAAARAVTASPSRPRDGSDAGLAWQPFSEQALKQVRSQGRPVLVDFTAAWCVSCQVNELMTFHSPEVQRKLKDLGFALLKADWTNQDPAITRTLASFGRSGVPFYLIYGPGGGDAVALPEVLDASILMKQLEKIR